MRWKYICEPRPLALLLLLLPSTVYLCSSYTIYRMAKQSLSGSLRHLHLISGSLLRALPNRVSFPLPRVSSRCRYTSTVCALLLSFSECRININATSYSCRPWYNFLPPRDMLYTLRTYDATAYFGAMPQWIRTTLNTDATLCYVEKPRESISMYKSKTSPLSVFLLRAGR